MNLMHSQRNNARSHSWKAQDKLLCYAIRQCTRTFSQKPTGQVLSTGVFTILTEHIKRPSERVEAGKAILGESKRRSSHRHRQTTSASCQKKPRARPHYRCAERQQLNHQQHHVAEARRPAYSATRTRAACAMTEVHVGTAHPTKSVTLRQASPVRSSRGPGAITMTSKASLRSQGCSICLWLCKTNPCHRPRDVVELHRNRQHANAGQRPQEGPSPIRQFSSTHTVLLLTELKIRQCPQMNWLTQTGRTPKLDLRTQARRLPE